MLLHCSGALAEEGGGESELLLPARWANAFALWRVLQAPGKIKNEGAASPLPNSFPHFFFLKERMYLQKAF